MSPEQLDLGIAVKGMDPSVRSEVKLIARLLEETTSLPVVSTLLKGRNLPSSAGSWHEMFDTRLLPYVASQRLTLSDLRSLLADAEEHGRSHSFLFQCKKAAAADLIDSTRVKRVCKHLGIDHLITNPITTEMPAAPVIAAVRTGNDKRGAFLLVKVIETREERKFLGESRPSDGILRHEWELLKVRAVNVARLYSTGLFELRIRSHLTSTRYREDIRRLWFGLMHEFFSPASFLPFSLSKVKAALWELHSTNGRGVKFSDSTLRNAVGTILIAAAGSEQADLFEDNGATKSLDAFLNSGGYCDASNIWFIHKDGFLPSKNLHVMLAGENNEFAVTAHCSKEDFEYVFDKLVSLA